MLPSTPRRRNERDGRGAARERRARAQARRALRLARPPGRPRRVARDPGQRGHRAARPQRRRQVVARARRRRRAPADRRTRVRSASRTSPAVAPRRSGRPVSRSCPRDGACWESSRSRTTSAWPRTRSARSQAREGIAYALELFPALERRWKASGAHALGRRAADGRARPGPRLPPEDHARRRAVAGPRTPRSSSASCPTLASVAESGVGVLLIEQFAHVALGLAKTAYVIEGGRIRYQGPPRSSRAAPRSCTARTSGASREYRRRRVADEGAPSPRPRARCGSQTCRTRASRRTARCSSARRPSASAARTSTTSSATSGGRDAVSTRASRATSSPGSSRPSGRAARRTSVRASASRSGR